MKKSKIMHYPKGLEISYKIELLRLINAIEVKFYKEIDSLLDENFNNDDFVNDINLLFDRLSSFSKDKEALVITGLTSILINVFRLSSNQVKQSLVNPQAFESSLLDDIQDFDFINELLPTFQSNALIRSSLSVNIKLVKSIPVELLDDLSYVIEDGFRSGASLSEITKSITSKFNISKNRADNIARTEIAKLHSDTLRAEYLKLGIETYEWNTSNDERVRISHKVLNGKTCSWNDPTIYKDSIYDKRWKKRSSIGAVEKHIGQDYRCRCSPSATLN